jgi:hypothetical protein
MTTEDRMRLRVADDPMGETSNQTARPAAIAAPTADDVGSDMDETADMASATQSLGER